MNMKNDRLRSQTRNTYVRYNKIILFLVFNFHPNRKFVYRLSKDKYLTPYRSIYVYNAAIHITVWSIE